MTPEELHTTSAPLDDPSATGVGVAGVCLCILTCIAVVAAMAYLGPIVIPVLVAIFLYFVIRPLANVLLRWKIPRWLTYFALGAVVMGCIVLISNLVYEDASKFVGQLPQFEEQAKKYIKKFPGTDAYQLESQSLTEYFNLQPGDIYQQLFGTAWHFTESLLMVFFYLIFILLDVNAIPNRIRRAFPHSGNQLVTGFEKISDAMSSYMQVKTVISAGMAVTAGVIMVSLGLSNWLLWAFLTFLLNYITYIGSLAVLVPPILMGALEFDSWWKTVLLTVLLCANRLAWIDFLEIRYSGEKLRLNNVLLLFSIAFWGWFWGVTGMVLAVPMLSALRIVLANFDSTRRWAVLMSDD